MSGGIRLSADLRKFAREVAHEGWRWEILGSGHIRFIHPNTRRTVTAASTSGDTNKFRILRRQMRRALENAG